MKIAYAGDWHANTNWAVKSIEHARDQGAEIILHLGDYGYDFHPGFIEQVEQALTKTGIELWFVDGNHEDFTWLYKQPVGDDGRRQISEHVYHLPRGYRWEWCGWKFLAMGGAYSVDRRWRKRGVSWWSEEVITEEEIEKAGTEPVDIMISHDCPSGVTIPGLNSDMWPPLEIMRAEEHRDLLRKVVEAVQPKAIWHGHYHRHYESLGLFDYGPAIVIGLDMDATSLEDNIVVVDLPERQSLSAAVDVVSGVPGTD